jgi:hypothetical protein
MRVIRHLKQLITCAGTAPRRGVAQRDVTIVEDGAVASDGERIVYAGPDAGLPAGIATTAETIDGRAYSLVPGFVDAHTHALFAGDRRDELRRRLAGATYAEIAAQGGGIVSTVAATRAASEDDLVAATVPRLREMLACGTTTVEIKSGYGLDVANELKMLRAIRRLARDVPIDIVPTFMGAHEMPVEFRDRRQDYVRLVIDEMLPAVASDGLAEWCDVFCERGVFTPRNRARFSRPAPATAEAADSCGRARGERRLTGRGGCGRPVGRSPDLRGRGSHRGAPRGRRGRHAAAERGILPEARALRAGARAHRRRCPRRARDRRQSRRRILAVDPLRPDAGVLRGWA